MRRSVAPVGRLLGTWFVLAWSAAAAGKPTPGLVERLVAVPYDPTGMYGVGEPVGWTVTAPPGIHPSRAKFAYTVRRNNAVEIAAGELDLAAGPGVIEATLDEPAMVYVEIRAAAASPVGNGDAAGTSAAAEEQVLALGAAVAPTKLQPVAPPPEDFDEFWQDQVATLARVPPNPRLTPKPTDVPGIDYATLVMDHVDGGRVHGQTAKPSREGTFPGLVILQWAGPPYRLYPSWVEPYAAKGWLVLNIEPHDVLPDQPAEYYAALPEDLKRYEAIGRESREACYFRKMYLADYRAVEYVASHPQWDGRTLVVMGNSMGGQQTLCVAGLHPRATHLIAYVPAGCDLNGCLHGRQNGYPFFPCDEAAAMNTARYFDAVNFASRIRAKALVGMGFVDAVCPPTGIWTAYNAIPGEKEVVALVDAAHNHQATPEQQRPYVERAAAWLDALIEGREP
ncbi:MAG: acetylxylan esterase [Pirellulales bacterium]|nr:acetylxylan esterase [Pirellulales bacterium]